MAPINNSVQKKKAKKPKLPSVPAPRVKSLTPAAKRSEDDRRSKEAERRRWQTGLEQSVDNWSKYSPRFSLQVDIEKLAARPKNTEAAKLDSQRVMEEMVDWKADACSGRWEDSRGKLVLAVFSTHIRGPESKVVQVRGCFLSQPFGLWSSIQGPIPYNPGPSAAAGRTEDDILEAKSTGLPTIRHGLKVMYPRLKLYIIILFYADRTPRKGKLSVFWRPRNSFTPSSIPALTRGTFVTQRIMFCCMTLEPTIVPTTIMSEKVYVMWRAQRGLGSPIWSMPGMLKREQKPRLVCCSLGQFFNG